MFQFIKSIVPGSKQSSFSLRIQDKPHGNPEVSVVDDKVSFVYKKASEGTNFVISAAEISNLHFEKDKMSFIHSGKKYVIEGSNRLESLYTLLYPLVAENPLFKAENESYFTFDTATHTFIQYPSPVCTEIYRSEDRYYLRISDTKCVVHLEEITTDIQYYTDHTNQSFVWSVFSSDTFHTFCLKFSDQISFLEFKTKFLDALYRSSAPEPGTAQKVDKLYENIADCTPETYGGADDSESSEAWDEYGCSADEEDRAKPKSAPNSSETNKNLVMGSDQCFVTRGESLGVFDLNQDELKFRTHIKHAVKDPLKLMTHNEDNNLLVLEKDKRNELNLMDLARGEVIERWDVKTEMNDYFDAKKTDNSGTLVGVSDYALFRIDPRTKEKVVEKKEYKTKNEFSCGVAASSGNFAVASRKGDLRLYDKIGKRARSLLPGFGDSITGIDINADGSLILCTCKSYILVFRASSDYSKHSKEPPRRLQLQPQHLGYINEEISFTPAKFDRNDTLIITSTGKFVVKWRVKDVLEGKVYNYSLRALYDHVVDEDFVFNGKDIVVALKNDVRKISESDLKRPSSGPSA